VVNAGGSGFYRVAYDEALRVRLSGAALQDLSVIERYGLVDDAWAATLAGRMSAADMLGFLRGFGSERDQIVWSSIAVALRGLGRLVDGDALAEFQRVVRDLVGPALADLGDPQAGEPDLDAKLRGLLTGLAGVLGQDPAAITRGRELFDAAAASPASLDAELLAAATSIVAATGDEADFERMLDGFRHGSTPQEQLRHLMALAEFDDADLIGRTCAFALSGEVKTQNAPFLLHNTIANRNHGWLAWEIVRNHWEEANDRFPTNTIVRMVGSVPTLDRAEQVADVAAFFAEHPIPQSAKTLEQVLERQRVNAALRDRDADTLAASLTG
jgi:puromycin-sensitive aminopeptidase